MAENVDEHNSKNHIKIDDIKHPDYDDHYEVAFYKQDPTQQVQGKPSHVPGSHPDKPLTWKDPQTGLVRQSYTRRFRMANVSKKQLEEITASKIPKDKKSDEFKDRRKKICARGIPSAKSYFRNGFRLPFCNFSRKGPQNSS